MITTYGLTGGIACGKTTVSNMFAELGVPVIDADVIARHVVETQPAIRQAIIAHFGPEVSTTGDHINRAWLRQRIFHSSEDKHWLEQLLHPHIREDMQRLRRQTHGAYMIMVVPLLIENLENYQDLAGIIVVDTDETMQKQRLSARDSHSPDFVDKMLASQCTRQQRLAHADFVLHNHQDLVDLRQQVYRLHQRLYR